MNISIRLAALLLALSPVVPASAPLTGLADAIVDLVSSGNTLRANHLVEVERIMDISSRLVVNQAALKLKQEPIRHLIDVFARTVAARN